MIWLISLGLGVTYDTIDSIAPYTMATSRPMMISKRMRLGKGVIHSRRVSDDS